MLGLSSGSTGASASSVGPASSGAAPGQVVAVAHEAHAESVPPEPGEAQVRGAQGKRIACLTDRQPPGCVLRRYKPATRSEFWEAKLPRGVKDIHGGPKQSLTWGFWSGRSPRCPVGPRLRHQRGARDS